MSDFQEDSPHNRRHFLGRSLRGLGTVAAARLAGSQAQAEFGAYAGDRAFLLILNGREFPGAESELPFYPCRASVLEFRLEWHRIAGDEILQFGNTNIEGSVYAYDIQVIK